MAVKIQLRRDTSTNWTTVNPILSQGEIGLETDTGKQKVGNGVDRWNTLGYGVVDDHIGDLSNPHSVTASQTGAYNKTEFIDISAGVDDEGKPVKLNNVGKIDLSMATDGLLQYRGVITNISEIIQGGWYEGVDVTDAPAQGQVIIKVYEDVNGNLDLQLKDETSRLYEGGKPAGYSASWSPVSPNHLYGSGVPDNAIGFNFDIYHRLGANAIYVKVGGVWSDLASATPNNFEYDGVIATDTDKTRYLVNKLEPTSHKAPTHSGSVVTLSGDGEVKVPINRDLGNDTKQTATLGSDWVDNGGNSYTATNATSSLMGLSTTSGKDVSIDYTISNCTGGNLEGNTVDGDYTTVSIAGELIATGFTGDVLIKSVKEITTHGAIAFFNVNKKEFEQVGADGVGSVELVSNWDFSNGLSEWDDAGGDYVADSGKAKRVNGTSSSSISQLNAKEYKKGRYAYTCDVEHTGGNNNSNFYFNDGLNNMTIAGLKGSGVASAGFYIHKNVNININRFGYLDFRGTFDNMSSKETLQTYASHTLRDGTYGTVIKLHTNHFSQADLDAFTAEPELLIEWYFGTKTIPSGITKSADDKIYQGLREITDGTVLTPSGTNSTSNLSQFGIQALKLTTDVNSKITGVSTKIEGEADGRWLDMPMIDDGLTHHEVTKCLVSIKGDITEITEEIECS